MIKKLAVRDITRKLKKMPRWTYDAKIRSIQAVFNCKDFMAVVRMIGRIAKAAEKMDHHPDLHLTHYRRLRVVLTTHEAGGVSDRNLRLATKISFMVPALGI